MRILRSSITEIEPGLHSENEQMPVWLEPRWIIKRTSLESYMLEIDVKFRK
jgi:hypothetical protein